MKINDREIILHANRAVQSKNTYRDNQSILSLYDLQLFTSIHSITYVSLPSSSRNVATIQFKSLP